MLQYSYRIIAKVTADTSCRTLLLFKLAACLMGQILLTQMLHPRAEVFQQAYFHG